MQSQWTTVDDYFADRFIAPDPILDAVLTANAAAGLPAHDVSPLQGRFLELMARILRAGKVLEIGTLGAYSTIWMARALPPGGRIVTLEAEPRHAEVARQNLERAGVADRVDLRLAPALDSLPQIAREGLGPFDLVFIDADKRSNPEYLAWALKLTRAGSVIIGDNVVRNGAVADASSPDASVKGSRALADMISAEPRLLATTLQTVGTKGWDGFAMALVMEPG